MKDIIDILFAQIAERAKEQMNITLTISDKAKEVIVDKGYDPKYGARALRRKVQSEIEDVLAEDILGGKIRPGDRVSIITDRRTDGASLTFKVRK